MVASASSVKDAGLSSRHITRSVHPLDSQPGDAPGHHPSPPGGSKQRSTERSGAQESMGVEEFRRRVAQGDIQWPRQSTKKRQSTRATKSPGRRLSTRSTQSGSRAGAAGINSLRIPLTANEKALIHSLGANLPAATEEDLHRQCFDWVRSMEPIYPVLEFMMHVPNGGARSAGEGGKLKAMGVRKGVPDILLHKRIGDWTGLCVELKSMKGKISPEQNVWLDSFASEGYLVTVLRTVEDFVEFTLLFLNGSKEKMSNRANALLWDVEKNKKLQQRSLMSL